MGIRATIIPQLSKIPLNLAPDLEKFLSIVKEQLEVGWGRSKRGNPLDKFVTVRNLEALILNDSTTITALKAIEHYALNEKAIALLDSKLVDLQNGDSKSIVYTVPAGKRALITHVIIHGPTASLAGGTDFDIGSGGSATTWRQTVDLSSLTTVTTDYIVIPSIAATPVKYTLEPSAAEFGIIPVTGATADAQATMAVFGYLI